MLSKPRTASSPILHRTPVLLFPHKQSALQNWRFQLAGTIPNTTRFYFPSVLIADIGLTDTAETAFDNNGPPARIRLRPQTRQRMGHEDSGAALSSLRATAAHTAIDSQAVPGPHPRQSWGEPQ